MIYTKQNYCCGWCWKRLIMWHKSLVMWQKKSRHVAQNVSSCGTKRLVMWHKTSRHVALNVSSCGTKRLVMWHKTSRHVALNVSPCGKNVSSCGTRHSGRQGVSRSKVDQVPVFSSCRLQESAGAITDCRTL
jgi:hypothetical protein